MAQTRGGQNDKNYDPQTEQGVEGRDGQAKKRRGETNKTSSKRGIKKTKGNTGRNEDESNGVSTEQGDERRSNNSSPA